MLARYMAETSHRPYKPGRHDCAIYALDWVRRATGRDLTDGFRHRSFREGRDWLAARGFACPIDYAAAHLDEVPVALARIGDVAVIDGAFGIVAGEFVSVLRREGLGRLPLTAAARAFRTEGA